MVTEKTVGGFTNINKLFILFIIIGSIVIGGFVYGLEDNKLIECQKAFMKATNEIYHYNEENPLYKISLPIYNCNDKINSGTVAPAISGAPEREELTLRDRFGLGNCRFINDFHRLGKYNLEWMAYDIACEKGKSFDIKSPGDYRIEKIGYGSNLGNYIILRQLSDDLNGFTDVRIILGHVVTSLGEGHIFNPGEIIGQTNLSGESTGIHVHIELWHKYFNVSRGFAIGEEYSSTNGTALLNHRQWNFGQQKDNVYYFTSYNLGDKSQNDNSPCIGASGKDLCSLESKGIRTMALTSDVRKRLGINFGDKVKLTGDDGCSGVFQVEDEMNKRFRENPGVLRPNTPYYIKGDIPSNQGGVCGISKI